GPRCDRREIDAATVASQPAFVESLVARADPDLVLDVRLMGVRRDDLDLDPSEIELAIAPSFLKARVRDASVPALTEGPLPSADTILGAFIRDLEARIRDLEAAGSAAGAGEPQHAPRLARGGRRASRRPPARSSAALGSRGLAVRVRRIQGRDFRRYRSFDIELAPGLTVIRGPNEAGKSTIQRALELAL